ncbi:hypothetical protein FEE95_19225 [Maribacter algarum]|uniref:DUF4142 domain-containing protein n=1 Tax=Maribacter algarum (ex Zhang et al. 2020) TaxID=2578118 RepID=A0A5S3Q8G5_9FLAO|nr:hypothetical protein [Maribacter algarum]TMM53201.1 hypothetical protein FEE95_19225 [Maribacter algarum]
MKTPHVVLYGLAILFLSSFSASEACNYAGSNMNYVKARTEEALTTNDINKARFYTYKAIKVLQTSTNRFDDCGCKDAEVNIEESLINLKAATKSTSLNGTRILLTEALQQIVDALDAFEQHEMHDTAFSSKDFAMNTEAIGETAMPITETKEDALYHQIDVSLENYSKSINNVIDSVGCMEARAFADNIFAHCEQQLLKSNLSEGKKYYNLRTKEITEKALLRLGDCGNGK